LDAKTETQEALPVKGQPSGVGESQPSTQPETFTKEQVAERHSKLDKTIADLQKANESTKKAIEAANAKAESYAQKLAEIEEQKSRDELNRIGDNPDALSLWQAKQVHKEMVAEFEKSKASFDTERSKFLVDLEEVKNYKTLKSASDIVSKPEYKGVDAQKLVDLTDGSPEKMEGLAKLLKAGMGEPTATTILPDSGKATGGAGEPNADELDKMSVSQYAEYYARRTKQR